jgi:predicted RNase H-like HicB family nuclease
MTTALPSIKYSLTIDWDPEDGIFVVTVPDLPGCRTHGRTYEEAARNAQDAIESWLEAARADGQPAPEPSRLTRNGSQRV